MTPRDRLRPLPTAPGLLTLEEVQRAIERLGREDRASLRPWILARYDVRGYRSASTFRPADPSD